MRTSTQVDAHVSGSRLDSLLRPAMLDEMPETISPHHHLRELTVRIRAIHEGIAKRLSRVGDGQHGGFRVDGDMLVTLNTPDTIRQTGDRHGDGRANDGRSRTVHFDMIRDGCFNTGETA